MRSQMSILGTIFWGVVSGVVTSFILAIAILFFNIIFIPWYQGTLYKDVRLDGKWVGGANQDNRKIKATIELKHKGFKIYGTFFAETTFINSNERYSNQYEFNGNVRNKIVILDYNTSSINRTGAGVALLKITNSGNVLSGEILHSENVDQINIIPNFKLYRSL